MPLPPGTFAGSAPASLDELLNRFPAVSPPVGTAGAAVTILLREGREGVETLLIERTERPTDPASGQVALPGGRVEDSDGSLARTALRELQEEVGLAEMDLAAPLRYVATENAIRFGLKVAIFAGAIGPTAHPPTPLSRDEVAHVFWLPRSALTETRSVHRETQRGLIAVPATVYDGRVLWGFTRRVVRGFFGLHTEDEWGGAPFAPDPSRPRPPEQGASSPTR